MDRIYNKANDINHLNQSGVINFPTATANLSVLSKFKTPQNSSTDQVTKNKILGKLSEKVLETFRVSMKSVYLERGENIYRPDEAIRFVYFPETAVFSEFKILEDGRTTEIIMTGREGVTGVSSLINAHPPASFTKVLQGGRAWQMDSKLLTEKLGDRAEIKELIFAYFNQFVNQISQKVLCNGFHLIENRLCTWLLMLQDRTGGNQLNLTHEEIAFSLGVHRPSISQLTKKLREDEMIGYSRGNVSIVNRDKLKSVACPCYLTIN